MLETWIVSYYMCFSYNTQHTYSQVTYDSPGVIYTISRKKGGGSAMAKIDSAYDYYMSVYGEQVTSRYDTHKKSDLRKVYNSIVRTNKDSPLYKIKDMPAAQKMAIDVKENARMIQNVVASLSDNYGDFEDSFQKKVAVSSDDSAVEVVYVGDGREKNNASAFQIDVAKLASPQINTGNFLKDNAISFAPGSYTFDLATSSIAYEFQFNVNSGETNQDILQKLNNLINGSNISVSSEIISNGAESSALSLTSRQTGLTADENFLFHISPGTDPGSMGVMDLLGIHNITKPAGNSQFLLNGAPQESLSNTFTINNAFELTLKKTTPSEEPVDISFKANTEAIADNVQSLVDAFNGILDIADQYSDDAISSAQGKRLAIDMSSVSLNRKSSLEEIGIQVAEDGKLSINREQLADALTEDREEDTFARLSEFKDAIGAKANNVAIDPMKYVNKVVVEYKNPGRNFNAPYISSIYSGMMLDNYI